MFTAYAFIADTSNHLIRIRTRTRAAPASPLLVVSSSTVTVLLLLVLLLLLLLLVRAAGHVRQHAAAECTDDRAEGSAADFVPEERSGTAPEKSAAEAAVAGGCVGVYITSLCGVRVVRIVRWRTVWLLGLRTVAILLSVGITSRSVIPGLTVGRLAVAAWSW